MQVNPGKNPWIFRPHYSKNKPGSIPPLPDITPHMTLPGFLVGTAAIPACFMKSLIISHIFKQSGIPPV